MVPLFSKTCNYLKSLIFYRLLLDRKIYLVCQKLSPICRTVKFPAHPVRTGQARRGFPGTRSEQEASKGSFVHIVAFLPAGRPGPCLSCFGGTGTFRPIKRGNDGPTSITNSTPVQNGSLTAKRRGRRPKVDGCFSKNNEDLAEIYGTYFSSEMPYIDHFAARSHVFYHYQEITSINKI